MRNAPYFLLLTLIGNAFALGAPPDEVVVVRPPAASPRSQLGDAALQASYDTMWRVYEEKIAVETQALEDSLTELRDQAQRAGNLALVTQWEQMRKAFSDTGRLKWEPTAQKQSWKNRFGDASFPTGFAGELKRRTNGYSDAVETLEKGYRRLIADLTKANKVPEATSLQREMKGLRSASQTKIAANTQKPDPIVGKWQWEPGNGNVEFLANGTGTHDITPLKCVWACTNPLLRQYEIRWTNDSVNTLELSPDGKTMSLRRLDSDKGAITVRRITTTSN